VLDELGRPVYGLLWDMWIECVKLLAGSSDPVLSDVV
jgi:hypothetical protein